MRSLLRSGVGVSEKKELVVGCSTPEEGRYILVVKSFSVAGVTLITLRRKIIIKNKKGLPVKVI